MRKCVWELCDSLQQAWEMQGAADSFRCFVDKWVSSKSWLGYSSIVWYHITWRLLQHTTRFSLARLCVFRTLNRQTVILIYSVYKQRICCPNQCVTHGQTSVAMFYAAPGKASSGGHIVLPYPLLLCGTTLRWRHMDMKYLCVRSSARNFGCQCK